MKRIWVIILTALILSVVLDFSLLNGGHGDFAWSKIVGFFAFFGLIGCVALIMISKWLGHYWLQRKEDYYDRNDSDE